MTTLDHHYRVLGLTPRASAEDVKEAYRDLAQVWHPDRFSANSRLQMKAADRFREISAAYRALCPAHQPSVTSIVPEEPLNANPDSPNRDKFRGSVWRIDLRFHLAVLAHRLWGARETAPYFFGVIAVFIVVLYAARYYSRAVYVPIAVADQFRVEALGPPNTPPQTKEFSATRGHRSVGQRPRVATEPVANGAELIPPRGTQGIGEIRVVNRADLDAVAAIASEGHPRVALRQVYIRAASEVLLQGIGPGSYYLTIVIGSNWQPRSLGFAEQASKPEVLGPFPFWQIQNANSAQSQRYELVLKRAKK